MSEKQTESKQGSIDTDRQPNSEEGDVPTGTRRDALRAVGAGATFAALNTLSPVERGVSKKFRKQWERGIELRNRAGVKQWKRYLDKSDFRIVNGKSARIRFDGDHTNPTSTQGSWDQERTSSDISTDSEIDTQKITSSALDFYGVVATSDSYGDYVADMYYDWVHFNGDGQGEPPKDVLTIGWNSNYYDNEYHEYTNEGPGGGPYPPDHYDSNPTGSVFKYWDDPITGEGIWSAGCGTYMKPISGSTSSERDVEFKYYHNWSNVDYNVSFTLGPPSVSFGSDTKYWFELLDVSEGDRGNN